MKYIVKTILKKITEQHPSKHEQLRFRLCGFEDIRIYEAVAKSLFEKYGDELVVEARLSKEKWEEFKREPSTNQTALLSMENHGWISENNSLTYFRNLPISKAQLIVIMGTEAVEDQGGLRDFYYIDPERLAEELIPNYNLVFDAPPNGWDEEEKTCVNRLYRDLFSYVPMNICKLSDIADEWGQINTSQEFIQRFYAELPKWGLCFSRESLPTVNMVNKKQKSNLLQGNADFISRKMFRKMSQKQYSKYLAQVSEFLNPSQKSADSSHFDFTWPGWQHQSIMTPVAYADVLSQFIRGENVSANRQALLGVDFAVAEYIFGLKTPTGVSPGKKKSQELTGNPFSAFMKAIVASLSEEDESPFDTVRIDITSIELANGVDPLIDEPEETQLSDSWKKVCWFAGGTFNYILHNVGLTSSGQEISLEVNEDIFDPNKTDYYVDEGILTTASASKKLDKVRFEITHVLNGIPTDNSNKKYEWNFTLHDDWVIIFDQLCNSYLDWESKSIDSVIPLATVDNYSTLMGAKCEEEFLDFFEQSSLDCNFNLAYEATKHRESEKAIEWGAEFSALGRSFYRFCQSLRTKGFFADLLESSKGTSEAINFIGKYTKLGNRIINSTFTQQLEWVMDYYIHAFAIEESVRAITTNEDPVGCIIPPYHPAVLQKIIDQTIFLADGCGEWYAENEASHVSYDKICAVVDELAQLSQIQEGVDVFPAKEGKYFGTTHAFANYCICGTSAEMPQKWMKAIMRKDAVFDDDFNDSAFKHMNVSSKMLLDVIEAYIKALPSSATNLSVAVIDPEDLQPIIAALYQYIIQLKSVDPKKAVQIRLNILVKPENKGGKNYLSYWANTFFNQDEDVDLKIYLNEWNTEDDLEKLLDTKLDLIFIMDVLKVNKLDFIQDGGSLNEKISDCRFPIVFKPAPVSAASIKRRIELTQRQFSAATIHSQVVYYKDTYESFSFQRKLVVREVSIDKARKDLILMLHKKANWVICVDGGMDGALLRDGNGHNTDYEVIGFSTGKGPHGQYNLTITARTSIINAVENRLKARLKKAFGWDNAKTYLAAKVCMEEAHNLDGVSLLSAINPRDNNINEFLAYIMSSLQAKKEKTESALQVVVHLDSYQHWFEKSVLEDDLVSRSRPDFLQVSANIGEDGIICLDATVIECKIAKVDNSEERKTDAIEQVKHGIERLSKIFDPHSKSIRRRYWYSQLYRALAFSQITFQSDTQAFQELSDEMRSILEGNFEIRWSGKVMGYWKDMDGDNEVVTQVSSSPNIEIHEIPQKMIQRILLNDESAEVQYVTIPDDEHDALETDDTIEVDPDDNDIEKQKNDSTGTGSIADSDQKRQLGKHVPFTLDESILLLDQMLSGRQRQDAISVIAKSASTILRTLARRQGADCSDSFRSSAGLVGRINHLSAVFNGFENGIAPLSSTSVFTEVVELYKNDRAQFDRRLAELKQLLSDDTVDPVVPEAKKPEKEADDNKDGELIPTPEKLRATPNSPQKKDLKDVRVFIGKDRLGNKVFWDFGHPKLANRHLLITGTSGQGKTYSIQAMLKELAENGVSSVIFDYTEGFREDQLEQAFRNALADRISQNVVYFTGIPIDPFRRQEIEISGMRAPEKISDVSQRIATIFTHVYNFGEQQFAALYTACSEAMSIYGDQMDMAKFKAQLSETKSTAAKTVLSKMTPFFDSVEFQKGTTFDWNSVIQADGSVIIFQLTNYVREIQVVITEMMLWDAWHYFKKNGDKNTPFVVVLDEAQNLSMKMGSPAEIILREGRKFGWSAWFATQSLKSLSDVEVVNLHQAPYSLYFKPTDDEIVKISKQIDPVSSANWVAHLKALHKGQCIVTGDRVRPDGTFGAVKPTITSISSFEERENEQ